MRLTDDIGRKLINMNPFPDKGYVSEEVAERQFQVVLKGFNHLIQPENNFLYIGDEVGLGKTFIALGIASLLRHFSDHPSNYTDLIIVPKKNLQFKWKKEIRNFIKSNYLYNDNIVKSVIGSPVGSVELLERLAPFNSDRPEYVLMRNSSFSIASGHDEEGPRWYERLRDKLPQKDHKLFKKIYSRFRRNDILIKRAYAYLIQKQIPDIDLLIVDEAHHYRHGIGEHVSIRNQIASRVLGATEDDVELFEAFPELAEGLKSKVHKVLLLSATPINRGLHEIKNQLDCLLKTHIFDKIDEDRLIEAIEKDLNRFLIRGIMQLEINGETYSRNGYRHEHRLGNVNQVEEGIPQYLTDPKTTLVLCLMQYLTIKELKQKNNNRFEIGMLAGFESFSDGGEYEADASQDRRTITAKDEHIVQSVISSYYKQFEDYLPHPKQDTLVNEVYERMLLSEKSLIYVRRIASVREIERKLLKKYSDHLIKIIDSNKRLKKAGPVKTLLQAYAIEKDRDALDDTIISLSKRILPEVRLELETHYINKMSEEDRAITYLQSDIHDLFDLFTDDPDQERFKEEIRSHFYLKNIKSTLKDLAINILRNKWAGFYRDFEEEFEDETSLDEDAIDEERAPYFFQRYFQNQGKNFKKRSYTKDWFEINPFLINQEYGLFDILEDSLNDNYLKTSEKTDAQKMRILRDQFEKTVRERTPSKINTLSPGFLKSTFLTEFLLTTCREDFDNWIYSNNKKNWQDSNGRAFLDSLEVLNDIFRSIFRQGSGLLPSFLAEAVSKNGSDVDWDFNVVLIELLANDFYFVQKELKAILNDYDRILEKNFDDHRRIRLSLIQQLPVSGTSGHHKRDISKTAIQFRMPGYPYALITTDVLKEGEDLHSYCKNIYHYGIAWNPSDMEQRTGRIDRIDSLAYNQVKDTPIGIDGIPFERKLQVYYPYIADTLEVNQMVKLFNEMETFTDIFYNDLSAKIEKDANTDVDQVVLNIPEQRKGLLESKYDYDKFLSETCTEKGMVENTRIGPSSEDLLKKLKEIEDELQNPVHNIEFAIEPYIDKKKFLLRGNVSISGRNGPFKVYFRTADKVGSFKLIMESLLGGGEIYRRRVIKDQLYARIKDAPFDIYEIHGYIWTRMEINDYISLSNQELIQSLLGLVITTDKIEEEITGGEDEAYQ